MNEFLFTPAYTADPANATQMAEHILVTIARAGHPVECEPAEGGFRVRTEASEAEAQKLAPRFACRATTVSLAPVPEPVTEAAAEVPVAAPVVAAPVVAAPEAAVEVSAVETPAEPAVEVPAAVESVTPTEPPASIEPETRFSRRPR